MVFVALSVWANLVTDDGLYLAYAQRRKLTGRIRISIDGKDMLNQFSNKIEGKIIGKDVAILISGSG